MPRASTASAAASRAPSLNSAELLVNSFKASDSSPVDAWICPPKSEADATNWSAPLEMPAAVLSSVGPAALTDAVTESIAFEEALIASPVFFPINLEASARPAADVSEYLENASAAALLACAEFAERALPASWAAARAASALAAEPACVEMHSLAAKAGGGRRGGRAAAVDAPSTRRDDDRRRAAHVRSSRTRTRAPTRR